MSMHPCALTEAEARSVEEKGQWKGNEAKTCEKETEIRQTVGWEETETIR